MLYRVEWGFDAPEIDLVPLAPQPRSEGVRYARRTYGADGSVHQSGAYVELLWSILPGTSVYQALLAQFDLIDNMTREVTVLVRNDLFVPQRMSGIAVRPEIGSDVRWQRYFPRDVVILVKDLRVAT